MQPEITSGLAVAAVCDRRVVAFFESDSLSPPNGERAGVRGQYLKNKHLLTPTLSSTGNGREGEKANYATTDHRIAGISVRNGGHRPPLQEFCRNFPGVLK
jgi:hypothetical protein